MKQTIYTKCILLLAAFMVAMATFTACEKEEEFAVRLDAFGPTPLLRGESVRFIGSNLNKVTVVVFPENIEVTPTVVSSGEITAQIPQDAVDGFITLRYPGGSITTKSRIAYADAVAFNTVRGATADTARAGDTVVITGDNLTGVTQVVFSVDVTVESRDFIAQSRNEITLALPNNAQTGDVYLLAGAAESRHINLYVNGLSITSLTQTPLKPGRDTLTITGTNLDLAVSVIFAGDITVDAIPVSGAEVKAPVPANALNGKIKIVSTAELEYESADTVALVKPSSLTHAAANGYKAGNIVTISGSDLDLVTGVTFSEGVNADSFTYKNSVITVTIPPTAKDGVITLHTVAGNVPTSEEVKLVKPAITAVRPAEIQAGDTITITGADLDLAIGITVGGKDGSIVSQTETEIKAVTPKDASTKGEGVEVALTLANGTPVVTTIDVTFPTYCFIPELPGDDVEIKAGELLRVTVENGNKLTGVEVNNTSVQRILEGSTLYVSIPANAGGKTSLKLISGSDNIIYEINVTGAGPVTTEIWSGSTEMPNDWSGNVQLSADKFSAVKVGDKIKVAATAIAAGAQGSFKNGSWQEIAPGTDYFDITGDFTLEVTQDILTSLQSGGLIISGHDYTAIRVSISSGGGGSNVEPVADPTLVFFPFIDPATEWSNDGLGSGAYGDLGNVVAGGAGAPSEWVYKVDEDVTGDWTGYFANTGQYVNDANPFNSGNLTANGAVKMDIKIPAVGAEVVLKFRLKGTGGDFWYVWKVGELYSSGGTDWVTVTFPLADFKDDNGNGTGTLSDPATQLAHTSGQGDVEYGIFAGWGAGHITMFVDNVRFAN